MTATFTIEEFVAIEPRRNTLIGFCRVRTASGLIFHQVSIHARDGRAWASPGSRPQLDREGRQMRDVSGKTLWTPLLTFGSKAVKDRFSSGIIEAFQAAHPGVEL